MEATVIFYLIYLLTVSAFGIAAYVLRAIGFYSIAKRRGIHQPWMAWVPVLDLWVLGCISDQYQYVVKGRDKNKRKWLLGLNIALMVVYVAFFAILGVMIANAVAATAGGTGVDMVLETALGSAATALLCGVPLVVLAIAVMVIRYVAMYDIYTSCSPQNNVLFLVLSIFFTVTEPFFIFFIRKQDGGMPPRRVQPQYEPMQENQETV